MTLLAFALSLAVVACGAAAPPAPTEQTDETITVTRVDTRRGLVFELETSRRPLVSSGLSVKLTDTAPPATRDLVLHRPLAATCDVPGVDIDEFAGYWDERFQRFGTALKADDPDLPIAELATSCALYVGVQEAPDLATFPDRPFSRVQMK